MKLLIIRVSSLLKGFVLALIFSVFLQASLASANGGSISTVSDLLAITGSGDYVLTTDLDLSTEDADGSELDTQLADVVTLDYSTYISGTFTGTFTGLFGGVINTISGLTKPLFDVSSGDISNLNLVSTVGIDGNGALANTLEAGGTIEWVSFLGDVTGTDDVGGLVGISYGAITNSFATGVVTGDGYVGGLVGSQESGAITNSSANGAVTGSVDVGGLVGRSRSEITNSFANSAVDGTSVVGGLVGESTSTSTITNSYATGTVVGTEYVAGGLVGNLAGAITNSFAEVTVTGSNNVGGLVGESTSTSTITNSYAAGTVEGTNDVGGLVGFSSGAILNSYATGDVAGTSNFGSLIGSIDQEGTFSNSYGTGAVNGYGYVGPEPEILSIVNTSLGDGFVPAFEVDALINGGRPYLISLIDSYDVADTEETPSFNLRSYYTQAAKSLDKALAHFGFKSNFSSHPDLGFQALEQNQSNSPAVIQLFEVSEYQNSNFLLNKEDGLQLSISSYFKEPVEIWTQGLDGEYLYLGLVEFDKDGKAILPALKFDTANTYQLLMIKAADKLNEEPNLEAKVGQININVF